MPNCLPVARTNDEEEAIRFEVRHVQSHGYIKKVLSISGSHFPNHLCEFNRWVFVLYTVSLLLPIIVLVLAWVVCKSDRSKR